jgi:hypothetical protein
MSEKSINETASKLIKYPKVTTRLNELKSSLQKKFEYTAEMSFKKLEQAQDLALAMEYKNLNAFLKAEELKGKLKGLYVDRSKVEIDQTPFEIKIIE